MQEAIYEILCGEEDLLDDLHLVQKTYGESLRSFKILTQAEVEMVFGGLRNLVPVHRELFDALRGLRCSQTGVSEPIGKAVLQWVARVQEPYVQYCAGLIEVRIDEPLILRNVVL